MPEPHDPPPTEEGWYVLHDFRHVDWDAWRDAPERDRRRAVGEAVDHLQATVDVADAEEGGSAVYSVLGHKADLLLLHMRPTTADIGALERRFEGTEFARFTERATSFVSVTEASGYSERAREYFGDPKEDGDTEENGDPGEESGLARYIESRLKPTVPDATHVCFYPMDKRRQPEQNWYDLDFEERAEHMDAHGVIGRDYGGQVVQMITGAIAIDDWEWGVTLWGDALTEMKDLLYEMRFDPSTSQFADFGSFYAGRRMPPSDLPALLAGERVPTDGETTGDPAESGPVHPAEAVGDGEGTGVDAEPTPASNGGARTNAETGADAPAAQPETESQSQTETADDTAEGPPAGVGGGDDGDVHTEEVADLAPRLATLGLESGTDFGAGDYGLVFRSTADAAALTEEVDDLRESFEHYGSHVRTAVRANGGQAAVVSVWNAERAADTAAGFLTDLAGAHEGVRGPVEDAPERGSGTDDEGTAAGNHGHGAGGADKGRTDEDIRSALEDQDIYAGQPHGEDVYALVVYSEADAADLREEVEALRQGFDRYDTHEWTRVYEDPDSVLSAVVSLWTTQEAADTAADSLADLPAAVDRAGEADGFGTMGMFYTVEPEHRDQFVGMFDDVEGLLAGMDGHRQTALLVNDEDENDMFIASQWDAKEDAMQFFRSEEFAQAVDVGRDILADRPRHVFLV